MTILPRFGVDNNAMLVHDGKPILLVFRNFYDLHRLRKRAANHNIALKRQLQARIDP